MECFLNQRLRMVLCTSTPCMMRSSFPFYFVFFFPSILRLGDAMSGSISLESVVLFAWDFANDSNAVERRSAITVVSFYLYLLPTVTFLR